MLPVMSEIKVVGLNYYPIKGCAAVPANNLEVTAHGFAYDRAWTLVDGQGSFLSQRKHPQLATVQAQVSDENLWVATPDHGELVIPLDQATAEPVPVTIFDRSGTGRDQGRLAQRYFSDLLGDEVRLLRIAQPRPIEPACEVAGAVARTAFADGFPFLLTSQNSLANLNGQLEVPVPMDRFRPNVVVEGAGAYDEDFWRHIIIGSMHAYIVRACARCLVPNIDQTTGQKSANRPVSRALQQTRAGIDPIGPKAGVFFGQNLVHVFEPGTIINLGDPVTLVEWATERNIKTK